MRLFSGITAFIGFDSPQIDVWVIYVPDYIIFGFGNPPSRLLKELHLRASGFLQPPPYLYQAVDLGEADLQRSFGILASPQVLGCHFASALDISQMGWLDRLGPAAVSSGRVSVVYKEQQQLIGEDTQLSGSLRALQGAGFRIEGSRVLLLGSGFEAQSIARSLAELGMRQLLLLHSSVDRVRAMANALKRDVPSLSVMIGSLLSEDLHSIIGGVDLLITALSPSDQESRAFWPVHTAIPQHLLVFDLIAEEAEERRRILARSGHTRYIDASALLLWQNAEAYRLWNRQDPPMDVVKQVIADAEL